MTKMKSKELLLLLLPVIILAGIGVAMRNKHYSPFLPEKMVQVNKLDTYVSSNPLQFGKEIRFSYKMPSEQVQAVEAEIENRFGPGGVTIQPIGQKPVRLSTVEVQSSYVQREVLITQGRAMLYQHKAKLTTANLPALASFKTSSTQWGAQPRPVGKGEIAFSVSYRRYYKLGNSLKSTGMRNIVSQTTLIPIL